MELESPPPPPLPPSFGEQSSESFSWTEDSDSEEVSADEELEADEDYEESSEAPVPMRRAIVPEKRPAAPLAGAPSATAGFSKGMLAGAAGILTLIGFALGVVVGRYAFPAHSSAPTPAAVAGAEAPKEAAGAEPETSPDSPDGSAGSGKTPKTAEQPSPDVPMARLSGRILYHDKDPNAPAVGDDGASVVVFPSGKSPNEKVEILGLRPQDINLQNRPGRDQVLKWEGAVGTVDRQGSFALGVKKPRGYYVLVISANVRRESDHPILQDDLSVLSNFFADPNALIGDRAYALFFKQLDLQQPTSVVYTLEP